MNGLPDRTGDPKDSEFGRQPVMPPAPNGDMPEKEGTPNQADTPFAEFVSCFLCGALLSTAVAEGRKFWMTSCDHVLCSGHAHEKGRCTSCGQTGIATYIIDKELPHELRTFLLAGGQLLRTVEQASSAAHSSGKALKYQGDQLMRTVRALQSQLALARKEKASMTTAIFEKSKSDKEAWDREKLALQTEIGELKNIIAVKDQGLPSYMPNPAAGTMTTIEEEPGSGESGRHEATVLGKRSHDGSSPGLRKAPTVNRITLPPHEGSSSGPYSSPRSAPRHLEQVRTNLGQFRYNPTPEPQTPMNGRMIPYRPSLAQHYSNVPPHPAMGATQVPMTPAPNNIVARLRQNGRSERDDSPSRPMSAMAPPATPGFRSPMLSAPSPYRPRVDLPGTPAAYHQSPDVGFQGQLATPRHHMKPRF